MENWKLGKGVNSMPGGGFVKVPEENKASKLVTFKLTPKQYKIIFSFCLENKISFSDLVRTSVHEYINKNGFNE